MGQAGSRPAGCRIGGLDGLVVAGPLATVAVDVAGRRDSGRFLCRADAGAGVLEPWRHRAHAAIASAFCVGTTAFGRAPVGLGPSSKVR